MVEIVTNSRLKAYEILENIEKNGAFSNLSLKDNLGDLNALDKALVTKIVYGVLQNKFLIDFYIKEFTKGKRVKPKIKNLLRLSVYQILFMDKIPDNATINEAVEVAKTIGLEPLSGFVNAILRNISRNKEALPNLNCETKTEFYSIKYSHPEKLVDMIISDYGLKEARLILEANNTSPELICRVNTLKTTTQKVISDVKSAKIIERDTILLDKVGNLDEIAELKTGEIYVQDLASQKAIEVLNPKPYDTVIDVCGAPGGKSFLSAIKMENKGEIFTFDIYDHKVQLIQKTAEKLGINIIKAENFDARKSNEKLILKADKVICDVPCSGFGIIRRKPEIRYKEDVSELPKIQLEILKNASNYVKNGGVLLYTTCTILKTENSEVVEKFLLENDEFYLEEFELFENLQSMITLLTHKHKTDGFFIAKIRRK